MTDETPEILTITDDGRVRTVTLNRQATADALAEFAGPAGDLTQAARRHLTPRTPRPTSS